jgi:hypothetical protein
LDLSHLNFSRLDLSQLNRLTASQAKAVAGGGALVALVMGLGAGWLAREPMDAALAKVPAGMTADAQLAAPEAPLDDPPPPTRHAPLRVEADLPAPPAAQPDPSDAAVQDEGAAAPDAGPPTTSDPDPPGRSDEGPREYSAPPPYPPGPDDGGADGY